MNMKKIFYITILLSNIGLSFSIVAQNLVPNPSFEDTFTCPIGAFDIYYDSIPKLGNCSMKNWYSPSGSAHPAFNSCAPATSNARIPNTPLGFQYPHSGDGFAELTLFAIPDIITSVDTLFKGYIQNKLIDTLIKDNFYKVSFYVSLIGYEWLFCHVLTTDDIGANLNKKRHYILPSQANIPLSYSIRNPKGNYITDTAGWTLICGVYKAEGGEQFITIGNFEADNQLNILSLHEDTSSLCTSTFRAIDFFIDDVSVENLNIHNSNNDTLVCNGESFSKELSAYANAQSYLWNTGETTQSITVSAIGKYWVTMQVDCGTVTDTINITAIQKPFFDIKNYATCKMKDSLFVSPIAATKYKWSTGNLTDKTMIANFGTYWLTTTDVCENSYTDTFKIESLGTEINDFSLGNDTMICNNSTVLKPSIPFDNNNAMLWSNGNRNLNSILVENAGSYWVEIKNNCFSKSDTITIFECINDLFFPTAFSPNQDGKNDDFKPITKYVDDLKYSIYNRYGNCVFTNDNALFGWDGKYKTVDCPMGTYFYICKYKIKNQEKIVKGDFELVR
jgi:gliding motility-associated-like protein